MFLLAHFQKWLEDTLAERNMDFFTYINRLVNQKTLPEPDGAIIVLMSAMLDRDITLVHQKGTWHSDCSTNHNIVLAYIGHNQYYPTQVGK